ncbi:LysR family transcriptional regulator [Pseudonocardia eucalypti]|uniref:LysR family transcriptional regulator n=1 Tax=Pseudonocardia eucalypti TaxID=648755 RepID=A0ABP9REJ8_9PSEU|nr:DNA-binding transcriptional LysR family regulator [Pseudonocardia eucalypti]
MFRRPNVTLAQVQYFVAAAEAGSISAAAGQLHTSQSALSSAIHRLERELGCALFIRHHARGIALTPAGRGLLERARHLLRAALELEDTGRELCEKPAGELSAGFFTTLAPFYVPHVLSRVRTRHPQLRVRVLESDGAGLHTALRQGECEIALSYRLEIEPDMTFDPLATLRPYALVWPEHPVAGRDRATLRELARTPMVLLDLPEPSRFMLRMLAAAGARPPEIIRTTSFETMRGLVAAGEGFTILNQRPAAPDETTRAITITDAEPLDIGLLRVAAVRPNRRMAVFARQCREAVELVTRAAG